MLLGLVQPTAGTATIGGSTYHDLAHPLQTVGAALEASNFHPGRSGRDHLRVLADASGIPTRRVDELLELVGIPAAGAATGRRLLDGDAPAARPRRGAAGRPAGAAARRAGQRPGPRGIRWLREFLRHLAGQGKTILVSSHMLSEVEQTVDDVVIIANGRSVAQGPIASLRGEPTVFVRAADRGPAQRTAGGRSARRAGHRRRRWPHRQDPRPGSRRRARLPGGVPLHELRPLASDLEDLFFRLTSAPEHRNRNRGAPAARTRIATPAGARHLPGRRV
jgi:ABC-2 type transport system ATP-binding protein